MQPVGGHRSQSAPSAARKACTFEPATSNTVPLTFIRVQTQLAPGTISTGIPMSTTPKKKFTPRAKHGHSPFGKPSPTYRSWDSMIQRCTNPKNRAWKNYGARGVQICPRWRESFEAFLQDVGLRPDGMTLDRKDGRGNYLPENCQWATKLTQNNNRRDSSRVTKSGVTMTVAQWARELRIPETTIRGRLKRGLTGEEALATDKKEIR